MLVNNSTARAILVGQINILKKLRLIAAHEHKRIIEVLSGCSAGDWLRKASAAEYLSVSVGTLENYVAKGELKAHRLNKSLRFKREDLDTLLKPVKED